MKSTRGSASVDGSDRRRKLEGARTEGTEAWAAMKWGRTVLSACWVDQRMKYTVCVCEE